ncbi:MAG TPA: phosphoribosyltransferase family protein [Candidatus Saccharimonadales bacterium]
MIKHTFGLYALNKQLETESQFSLEDYSKFKYGDGSVAKQYAAELASFLQKNTLLKHKKYCLTGSAYHNTPTAATSIAKNLFNILKSHGVDIIYTPLKCQAYAKDYSSMDFGQRANLLADNKLAIDTTSVNERRSLIVIDDIRITGLHELAIENFLLNQNIEEVIFGYVIMLLDTSIFKNPKLEHAINHMYVDHLDELAHIVRKEEFNPNARICKFILSAPTSELEEFLRDIPSEKLQLLINLIEQDGYHLLDIYRQSYSIMKAYALRSLGPVKASNMLVA